MTSSDDGKTQIKLNIKQRRKKRHQYLKTTNDTFLKPKIESVSKYVEKSDVKPKIEIIDSEPSEIVLKKLSVQLLEETRYSDGSDDNDEASVEDLGDDDISVGTNDCNEAFTIHNNSDVEEISDVDENEDDKQLVHVKINKKYLDNNNSSGVSVLDVNSSTTKRKKYSKKRVAKSQTEYNKRKRIRSENEKKSRDYQAKLYDILRHLCSDFYTQNKLGSKVNILCNAKHECDMLKRTEDHLCREKKNYRDQRKLLKKRLAEIIRKSKL